LALDDVRTPRPLYAMLAAHGLTTRNRAVRELGRSGVWLVSVALGLLSITFLLPLWLTLGGLGFIFGSGLPALGAEAVLGVVLFGVTFFGGAMSGAMGGAKQLAWESYRTYPVRTRSVFVAELVASALDLVPIVLGLGAISLLGGVAISQHAGIWLLPFAFVEAIIALLVLQLLVGTLAERLVVRLRYALSALALAVWAGATLVAAAPEARLAEGSSLESRTSGLFRVVAALGKAAALLPTSNVVRSFFAAGSGETARAALLHAYPITLIVGLLLLANRMVAREMSAGASTELGNVKLWSFATPTMGIARLSFISIMQSRVGRFGLVVPLLVLVLVRGPLAAFAGQSAWTIPGAYAYLSLVANQFQLNQFGLDGHGVKALLLLPISERAIFAGKAWGLFLYQALAALMLTVLLATLQHAPLLELTAGLLLFLAIVFMQNAVGRRTSVTMPRMTPRKDVRANATPIGLVLVGLLVSIVGGSVMSGAYVLLAKWSPLLLAPGMAMVALLTALVHRWTREGAVKLFRARRETLLSALG
jgi:hypothetical protein